jgi:hypothetical protein
LRQGGDLSIFTQNSVSLAFRGSEFAYENFPKSNEERDNPALPAVPPGDKLGRQSVEAFLLGTLPDD